MTTIVCIAAIMINLSVEQWNDFDARIAREAKFTCLKKYSSCLTEFIKKEPRVYNSICGERQKTHDNETI